MKNKTLLITLPAALLLVAAAFYLPSYISRAQDRVLLDTPYVTLLENSREEFSDSMRLSVPGEADASPEWGPVVYRSGQQLQRPHGHDQRRADPL